MKILRILGIVVAAHVLAFTFLFAIQGCSSTTQSVPPTVAAAPTTADSSPAAVQFNPSSDPSPVTASAGPSPVGADLNPATAPAASPVSQDSSLVLYSPTRPGTPAAAAIEASASVSNVTPVATHVVAKGENLRKIAVKYHLTTTELAKANGLKTNARLKVGQKLIIPGKASSADTDTAVESTAEIGAADVTIYKVKAGDSLRQIARHHGTTLSELRALNHLKSDTVRVGQQLKIPAGAAPGVSTPATETASAPETAVAEPVKNSSGQTTHVVKAGEKLATIARKYGVTVGAIATANNISDPGKIQAGQQLIIPDGHAAGGNPEAASTPADTAPPPPASSEDLDSGLKPTVTEPPVIKVDDSSNNPAAPAPASDIPPPSADSTTPTTP
jgi:LysM repeat protein